MLKKNVQNGIIAILHNKDIEGNIVQPILDTEILTAHTHLLVVNGHKIKGCRMFY